MRNLPDSLPQNSLPIKSAQLSRAKRAVLKALYMDPQTREMDEMRTMLAAQTCLSMQEIDAALAELIATRQIVGTDRKGWRVSKVRAWFEATVVRAKPSVIVQSEENGSSYVLHERFTGRVLTGDRVMVAPSGFVENDMPVAMLEAVLSHRTNRVVCRLVNDFLGEQAVPVDTRQSARIWLTSDTSDLADRVFVVELTPPVAGHGPETELAGAVVEILGNKYSADVELRVALERFELPHEFSPETMAEANELPESIVAADYPDRVDLTDVPLMTIDGEDSKDFDDAVWAARDGDGWRLLVAIADVSSYVRPDTALDRCAQERATSVYFPRCVIPMLPEKLSNGLCSLNPGVDRLSFVCDMLVNAAGTVTAYQFYRAVIRSAARQTYGAVWQAINGDKAEYLSRGGNEQSLEALTSLFAAFSKARAERGAINFESAETQLTFDEAGLIASIARRDHNDAHRLIEECMLAANTCAAHFIDQARAESLYRVHPSPDPERLSSLRSTLAGYRLRLGGGSEPQPQHFNAVLGELKDDPACETIQLALLRAMSQAFYSPCNIGHYGLNYPAYTHFTSPIRRYPDLLVHRTIGAILEGRRYAPSVAFDPAALMNSDAGIGTLRRISAALPAREDAGESMHTQAWRDLGSISSAAERRADEASRDVTAWLKCMYMRKRVGKIFDATVTSVIGAGLFVTLKDQYVDGFVHISRIGNEYYDYRPDENALVGEITGKKWQIGNTIRVRLARVDLDERRIDFDCADMRSGRDERPGRFEETDESLLGTNGARKRKGHR